MSDTDQLSTELRELRELSHEFAVPARPSLAAIAGRGRRIRRRRRLALAGTSVACAAVASALGLELVGSSGTLPSRGPGSSRAATVRSGAPAKIRTAAFTIIGNLDGTVTLIINPVELFEPTTLQDDLAKYGIPALVTSGQICTSDPAPAGLDQVESYDPGTPGQPATITIDPSAMPPGSELSFGTAELNGGVRASYSSLIDPNSYSCTTTPPTDADPHPARAAYIKLDPAP
jgi:hypothetical protein